MRSFFFTNNIWIVYYDHSNIIKGNENGKSMVFIGSQIDSSLNSRFCVYIHFAMWSWVSNLTSLSFSLLVCQLEVIHIL